MLAYKTGGRMVSTFKQLRGRIINLRRFADPDDKKWSAFNPSIAAGPDGRVFVAFRSSNYIILEHGELAVLDSGPIRNRVWVADLDDKFKIHDMRQLSFENSGHKMHRGVEDPRLLYRDNRWMFTAVAMERHIPRARHCECYLNDAATEVIDIKVFGGVDAQRPEKNWMTAARKPERFDYVYNGTGIIRDGHVVHRMDDVKELSGLRGNAHLLEQTDGTYLGIMHHMIGRAQKMYSTTRFATVDAYHKNYLHYLVRVNEDGWVIEVGEPFQFVSPGIEFASGLMERDDELLISFGKDDVTSHIGIVPKSTLVKRLKRIGKP